MKTWSVVLICAVCACGGTPPAGGSGGGSASSTGGGSGGSGGGSSGAGGGSSGSMTCESATAALCDRALACGGSTRIVVALPPSATAEHMTISDCKNYYRYLVCPSAEGDAGARDWAACQSAATQAACVATSKGDAVPLPSACPGLTL